MKMFKRIIYKFKNFICYLRLSKDEREWAKMVYHWDYITYVKNKKLGDKLEKEGRLKFHDVAMTDMPENMVTSLKKYPVPFFILKNTPAFINLKNNKYYYDEPEVIDAVRKVLKDEFGKDINEL